MKDSIDDFDGIAEDAEAASALACSLLSVPALLFILGWFRLLLPGVFSAPALVSLVLLSSLSILLWGIPKSSRLRKGFLRVLLWLFALGGSLSAASAVLDVSFDGQMYHQEAVLQFMLGWNPIAEPELAVEEIGEGRERIAFLLTHYPKGYWLAASQLAEAFSDLKAAKAINLLLLFSAFLAVYAFLRRSFALRPFASFGIAALAVFSPVVSSQLFTFYLDGALSLLLVTLLSLFLLSISIGSRRARCCAVLAAVLLLNIKFTAVPYVVLLLFGVLCWAWKTAPHRFRQTLDAAIGSLVLGVLVFGYQPYVFNQSVHGYFLYPVQDYPISGRTPSDESLIVDQLPADFVEANRIEKLVRSLFARTENVHRPKESSLKMPWQVSAGEFEAFKDPDVRCGGFGPMFALLGSAACVLFLFVALRSREGIAPLAWFSGVLLASVLINPEAWWARYVPQLWLFPLALLLWVFLKESRRVSRVSAVVLMVLFAFNSGLSAHRSLRYQIQASSETAGALEELNDGKLYDASFGMFPSSRYRLQQFGVRFRERTSTSCESPRSFPHSMTTLCRIDEGPSV